MGWRARPTFFKAITPSTSKNAFKRRKVRILRELPRASRCPPSSTATHQARCPKNK